MGEFLCADGHEPLIAAHQEALSGIACLLEYTWKNRVLEIRLDPLRSDSGDIVGCLAMALDITDRKKTEEQALYQAP